MRILLVVNPYATNYDEDRRRVVEKALGADHDLLVAETNRHGHGLPLTQGAVTGGFEAVVVWGGDGTVNEAANGLVGTDVGLGIIPGGSTNVTARTLGIPNDVTAATGLLLRWLGEGRTRRIGLGKAGERYFTFASGLGFDAALVYEVEARSMLKRTIGPSVYIAAGFAAYASGRFERHRPSFVFHYDDGTSSPPLYLAEVSNSSPYTFLGNRPLVISPKARHDRPLEVFALTSLHFWRTLATASASFVSPRLVDRVAHCHRKTFTSARVEALVPFDLHCDAEYRGRRDDVTYTWEPACLTVYSP